MKQPRDFSKETKRLDSVNATMQWEKADSVLKIKTESKLFSFNPNLASRNEFIQLGFEEKVAGRIVNYRAKGGKFLVKKDLLKVYGIDSSFYLKLIPFIQLPENIASENKPSKEKETKPSVKTSTAFQKFDLNTADSSQLIKVYGIGAKLSARIVTYREKLGGFVATVQLKEVYGLDSVVIDELKSKSFITENFQPKQININSASEKEIGAHPYIKYKVAKAIAAYRFQHGKFQNVNDLKKIALIDEAKFNKMKPYLKLD
ncbi:MAG: helix-hairpin-helix domain-containing protein [Cyclobacteriaceae bacterium]